MTKQPSSKPGFVIKLSTETAQKLAEEDQLAKAAVTQSTSDEIELDGKQDSKSDLEGAPESKDNLEVGNVENITEKSQNQEADKGKVEKSGEDDTNDLKNNSPSTSEVIPSQHNESLENKNKSDDKQTESENSWGDYAPYITYEGQEAIYTDPTTQQKYTWSKTSNSWEVKTDEVPGRVYSYEDDTHIYTEADGSKYFWDVDKKAWIPKVDDDFLAFYQMSYGFVDNKKDETKDEPEKKEQKKIENVGLKRKSEPQWFQPPEETNTKVYVSNLPQDINEEEFVNFMQKCGLVERDPSTQKMKVKLYMDKEHNCFKGDALCTYIKIESVDLALKLLDGSDFKGHKVKVERAHFQLKGDYNPALKPKKKKKKELEKIKKMKDKLFDWRPEKFIGERSKHEKVVIIKNLFHPTDFDKEVQLILDYQQDLREECGKCGEVRKVIIYDRHPEGVAQVSMKEPEQADEVVQLINGRWFGKRQITAEIWDGRTKYKIAETDADINQRINKWENFLEGKEDNKQEKEEKSNDKQQNIADSEEKKLPKEIVENVKIN